MFFFLPGMALRYLEKPKGKSYSNFDVWLLNTNKLKIFHVIFTTRADKGNLFHLLKDESRKKEVTNTNQKKGRYL